jgi:hypothetical protein
MAAMAIQICRADTEDQLQVLIGAAIHFWSKKGFTKVNVTYVSPDDMQVGVFVMTAADKPPEQIGLDTKVDHTAVLVLATA